MEEGALFHPQRILEFEVGDYDRLFLGAFSLFDRNIVRYTFCCLQSDLKISLQVQYIPYNVLTSFYPKV